MTKKLLTLFALLSRPLRLRQPVPHGHLDRRTGRRRQRLLCPYHFQARRREAQTEQ